MEKETTVEYLSKLLNRQVEENAVISLSSAQRNRLYGWLIDKKIAFAEDILLGSFSVNQLLLDTLHTSIAHETVGAAESLIPLNSNLVGGSNQIGIDIQRVDELFPDGLPCDPKSSSELLTLFTMHELSYAQSKDDPKQTLAGIYCAKEAIIKAAGIDFILNQIEIGRCYGGAPLHPEFAISISHSGNYAIAVALKKSDRIKDARIDESNVPVTAISKNFRKMDIIYCFFFIVIFMYIHVA